MVALKSLLPWREKDRKRGKPDVGDLFPNPMKAHFPSLMLSRRARGLSGKAEVNMTALGEQCILHSSGRTVMRFYGHCSNQARR